MKLFISWSGEASRYVASALRGWLPRMLHSVSPWLSSRDIEPGQVWPQAVRAQLKDSSFAIVCVTPESQSSGWLMFESGAVSTALEGARVVPYCFRLSPKELDTPLSLFQGVAADKVGTKSLVESINAASRSPLSGPDLEKAFEVWWPTLADKLTAVPGAVKQILCASTEPYRDKGPEIDELILTTHYPGSVTPLIEITSAKLRQTLSSTQYQIVNLMGEVETKTGNFIFSNDDRLPPAGLAGLLRMTDARLVVLASCDSLALAARLSHQFSVVAAYDWVGVRDWQKWAEWFYSLLSQGQRLTRAFESAQSSCRAPMSLLLHRDLQFLPGAQDTA